MSAAAFGGVWLVVRRSLRQHAVSTCVTVLSVALAIGLTMSVFAVSAQTRSAFTADVGFDAVVGPRGAPLQIVLNSVFHLETSPGNLPWSVYETLRKDPSVELAVPYAVGDNYRGHRIVGTSEEIFTRFEYRKGERFRVQTGGTAFDPNRQEAVIGSTVAARTGLAVNSTFHPYHALGRSERDRHDEEYTVVGVLEPTNSPADLVVWIPIEGVFRIGGHVLRGTGTDYVPKRDEAIPDEAKEVSAVLLKLRQPAAGMFLKHRIDRQGTIATMAWPLGTIMAELFDKIGWMNRVLELVAYLVVGVAAGSILASLYNTMNERRREFAILRALGARRGTVFSVIVVESTVIAALGCVVGFAVYAAVLGVAAVVVRRETGVVLDVFAPHDALWATPLAMTALGALSGLLPAFRAYRTEVAENLVATS